MNIANKILWQFRKKKKLKSKDDPWLSSNGPVQLKETGQWGPYFLVEKSCKNDKKRKMIICFGRMVVCK